MKASFANKQDEADIFAGRTGHEEVLVLKIRGDIADFQRVLGLLRVEELAEFREPLQTSESQEVVSSDHEPLQIFITSTTAYMLDEIFTYWNWYKAGRRMPRRWAPLGHFFKQVDELRYWNSDDRLGSEIVEVLRSDIDSGKPLIRFELELWFRESAPKRLQLERYWEQIVAASGGEVISNCCLPDIRYHALLVAVPRAIVANMLETRRLAFVSDASVMLLQEVGQSIGADAEEDCEDFDYHPSNRKLDPGPIRIAVLDSLPVANHEILAGFIEVHDPDDWEATETVDSRIHGTAVASLVVHGDLQGTESPITSKIVCTPILRRVGLRSGCFPDDRLMVDLIHERIITLIAEYPDVRIINVSFGDPGASIKQSVSKLGRIFDFLAWKYKVLFVISAGNRDADHLLPAGAEFDDIDDSHFTRNYFESGLGRAIAKDRIIAPADSINSLTVGALNGDDCSDPIPRNLRVFPSASLPAHYSRRGSGFRKSLKPELSIAGGRMAFRAKPTLRGVEGVLRGLPGQKVAFATGGTVNQRGTTNAAALISHYGANALRVIDSLRKSGTIIDIALEAVLLKALLGHAVRRDSVVTAFRTLGFDAQQAEELAFSFSGYGEFLPNRFAAAADNRATLLGYDDLGADEAHDYFVPIPSSAATSQFLKSFSVTLAYLTPINCRNQLYRCAKLNVTVGADKIRSAMGVGASSTERNLAAAGTLKHMVFEGTSAVANPAGGINLTVDCRDESNLPSGTRIPYALVVSAEIDVNSHVDLYEEIAAALALIPSPEVTVPAPI